MFKRAMLLLMIGLLSLTLAPLFAQDDDMIAYGDTVSGEVTNANFEVPFRFEGAAGDVIVVEMTDPEGILGEFSSPAILLLGTDGLLLGSVSTSFSGEVSLVARLPSDGVYTLLASRTDGRSGTGVGAFNLTLILPEVLTLGSEAKGSLTDDDTRYYAYVPDGAFELRYRKTGGDFSPTVQVNLINSGELQPVAILEGKGLSGGSLIVEPSSGALYIITLSEALFDFNFQTVTADFTLAVSPVE